MKMQRLDTCRLKLGFELFPPSAASLFPDASLLNLSKIDREETQLEIIFYREWDTVTSLSLLGRISFLATRESLKFVIVIYSHLRACSPYEGDASFRNFVGELGQTIGIHLLIKFWDVTWISLHDQVTDLDSRDVLLPGCSPFAVVEPARWSRGKSHSTISSWHVGNIFCSKDFGNFGSKIDLWNRLTPGQCGKPTLMSWWALCVRLVAFRTGYKYGRFLTKMGWRFDIGHQDDL